MNFKYCLTLSVIIFLLVAACANKRINDYADEGNIPPAQQMEYGNSSEYILGPGDEVLINVWRNDDLTRSVKVDPSGKIYFPLAGEIRASGMTLSNLREEIALRLTKYLVNPQVDVNASDISSQKIYVLGEVNTPGTYELAQNIPVWAAISNAGSLTDDAKRDSLLLIRNENGLARVSALALDFKKMNNDIGSDPNVMLKNGDILYVPETFIADLEQFMVRLNNIFNPIVAIESGIVLAPQVVEALLHGGSDGEVIVTP